MMSRRWWRAVRGLVAMAALAGLAGPPLLARIADLWRDLRLVYGDVPLEGDTVDVALAYPLSEDGWLEFAIPPASAALKLVSNANLNPAARDQPQLRWRYALDYQVLDAAGRVLRERRYQIETRLTQYRGRADGRYYTGAFYRDGRWVPADGRRLMLDLGDLDAPARFRLRLAARGADVAGVVARLSAPNKVAEFRLASLWQRLTPEQQGLLARGSIYPPALLNPEERRNLLRNGWQPLGPLGVRERDYRVVPLYVLREIADEPGYRDLFMLPGLVVDPAHDAIIGIPEQGGDLVLKPRQSGESAGGPAVIELAWRGRLWKYHWRGRLRWDGVAAEIPAGRFAGGWLTIGASRPLTVQASLRGNGPPLEVTPQPHYARAYRAARGEALAYAVPRLHGVPIPFRLSLRPLGGSEARAVVEFLDAGRRVLERRELAVPPLPSRVDRLAGAPVDAVLSDPTHYFFNLPAEVAALRVEAEPPLLVQAFNQPPGMLKRQRVPEDAYGDSDAAYWNPAWFATLPEDAERLAELARASVLITQPVVEVIDPLLLEGFYRWQDYFPEQPWRGEYVLAPDEPTDLPATALHWELLPGHFCPLDPDRVTELELRGPEGLAWLSPTLLFERTGDGPFRLRLTVDGVEHYAAEQRGRRAVITLPPLAPGRHRLRLTGAPARYRISYALACPGAGMTRRLAFRLGHGGDIAVTVDKPTALEIRLSGRLHGAPGETRRSVIDATLEPAPEASTQPLPDWSFRRRRFDLRPVATPGAATLFGGEALDLGQIFSIPLAIDLPPGRYRVHLALREGPGGYLSLSTTEPGRFGRRLFSQEEPPDE